MNITFLQDYRGVLTGEKYYEAGTVVDSSDKTIDGEQLVKDGRAKKGGTIKGQKKEEEKE